MNYVAESYAWCMLQVSLFSVAAGAGYLIVRRRAAGGIGPLLVMSLATIGLLTLWSVSPWPRWDWSRWKAPHAAARAIEQPTDAADFVVFAPKDPGSYTEIQFNEPLVSPDVDVASPADGVMRPWWLIAVAVAWIASAVGLVRLVVGMMYMRWYRREAVAIDDPEMVRMFGEACAAYGIKRPVALVESERLGVAATIGWRRPAILLPPCWRDWSTDERRAVLVHELAHIRQRHFPAWFFGQWAVVAHFYHPLVHWLARRLRLEQEIAADQIAAEAFGDRRRYAATLAGLALGPMPRASAFASLGLFMSRPFLMRRIAMLRQSTDSRNGVLRWSRALAVLGLALVAVGVAGFRMSHGASAEPTPTPTPTSTAAPIPEATVSPAATSSTFPMPRLTPNIESNPALGVAREASPFATTPPATPGVTNPAAAPAAPPTQTPAAILTIATPAQGKCLVTALLQVSREPMSLTGERDPAMSDAAWEVFCNTQVALLRSGVVLQAALRSPEVAALPMVKGNANALPMLKQMQTCGFVPNTEILYVEMGCAADQSEECKQLVDAVVKAYMETIVDRDKQRQLLARDTLARSVENLDQELARKSEEYYDIAKSVGAAGHSGSAQIERELAMKRLDRIDAEVMRLEDENGQNADAKKADYYRARIEALKKRQQELEEVIQNKSEDSVDLASRKRVIDRLKRMVDELGLKIEVMDVDANAPDRVRVIQPATVVENNPVPTQ